MFNLGISEIAVILVVALVFVGPKMLPEIATTLGKVIREIRKATSDLRQDIELDDIIRKPLQELRDAATLAPDELKRRDEAKAARRKTEEEEQRRKQHEAAAQEEKRKQQEAEAKKIELAAVPTTPKPVAPAEVISAHGTMISNPPPDRNMDTITTGVELLSPPPVVLGPPPKIPPAQASPSVVAPPTIVCAAPTMMGFDDKFAAKGDAKTPRVVSPLPPVALPALARRSRIPPPPLPPPVTPGVKKV